MVSVHTPLIMPYNGKPVRKHRRLLGTPATGHQLGEMVVVHPV